jgi:hypothetical protein
MAQLRTASPIRVFGADPLADLALRLPAEANYLQALLHSTWSLRMTQVSASGLNCSRERTLNEEVAAAGIFAFIRYRRVGWSKGAGVPTSPSWVERNIVVPTTFPYSLTGDITKKLAHARSSSNSPSGTTFWAAGAAEDRDGRYFLALSVAGGSKLGN